MDAKNADTEAALSLLINMSGKMRMLSHRVALAAQQSLLAPDTRIQAADIYAKALTEFSTIYNALQHGDAAHGIPPEAAVLAIKAGAGDKKIRDTVERFLSEAADLQDGVKSGSFETQRLTALTFFVADELLSALNRITEAVGNALQQRLETRRTGDHEARSAMLTAVRSIGEVSMKVKLISLNASIEAARAGDQGKGFAVIATEIRSLSENAAETSNQIADYIKKLA